MIEINGEVLNLKDGGGQILRVALSLSCILKRPVHVLNIRAGRSKPGLAAQHLKGVQLLKEITNAHVEGDVIGSTAIKFIPDEIKSGKFEADTKTAGSIALLIQAALPVLYFAKNTSVLELKGGTNADKAPQIDFVTEILRSNLEKFGATFNFELHKRGYFPHGGGHCEVIIEPIKKLKPIRMIEFGQVKNFFGWSFVAGSLPIHMAHDMKGGAVNTFSTVSATVPIHVTAYKENKDVARNNCAGIIVGCETTTGCVIGGSALCIRGDKPFYVGQKAGMEIVTCINKKACVDYHTQDQLIIFMALADGVSRIRTMKPTLHTETAIHVVELMCDAKFKIMDQHDDTYIIECHGIGHYNISI